jgi:hypothetical protein
MLTLLLILSGCLSGLALGRIARISLTLLKWARRRARQQAHRCQHNS